MNNKMVFAVATSLVAGFGVPSAMSQDVSSDRVSARQEARQESRQTQGRKLVKTRRN